jgi:sialidase-1
MLEDQSRRFRQLGHVGQFDMHKLIFVLLVTCWVPVLNAEQKSSAPSLKLSPEVRARCLKELRTTMRSDEFWPSIHAAEGLTLAGQGKEVRAFLAPKLADVPDDQKRCGVVRELVRAGDVKQGKIMLDILDKKDDFGHVHAAESLYKIKQVGNGKALTRAMRQTKNPTLRLMAAGAMTRKNNKEAFALLRESVNDKKLDNARIAVWLLGRVGDKSDISSLKKRMASIDDPFARCYFEHALAALGDKSGQAALLRNLTSKDARLRVYAATFAGDVKLTAAGPALIKLLDDENIDIRARAAQSLLVLSRG